MSIWSKLKRPIICLAPMSGVTDAAMRRVTVQLGKPDVFFTEFVSCAGLCSPKREELMSELQFDEIERPIVAQIFGREPDQFERCAELIAELGFDGVDVNTGCPDKKVQKQGAGAMLMKEPELTKRIIAATKRGAGDIPVSVKTRIGYDTNNLDEWLKRLAETQPAAISIHWRTKRQAYKGDARWDLAPKAVEIVRTHCDDTRLLGNGDVKSLNQAYSLAKETGVDGVMIGRRIFTNPWVFNPNVNIENVTTYDRLMALDTHLTAFENCFGDKKHFLTMRKYVRSYVNAFKGAKHFRIALHTARSITQMRDMINEFAKAREADDHSS